MAPLRGAALASLLVVAPSAAWAQRVEVTVVAPVASADALERSLVELFERVELQGRVARAPRLRRADVRTDGAAPDLVARVWIDANARDRCVVLVADPRADRVLVRRVPLDRGFDEIAREAVAHIVQDTVDALRRGQRIGLPREEAIAEVDDDPPPPPPPPPLPAPSPPSRAGLAVTLGWVVQPWVLPLTLAHGPELTTRWRFGRRGLVALHLDAGARVPLGVEGREVTLTLVPVPLRVGVSVEVPVGARWALGGGVGGGVDVVWVTPRASVANVRADPATIDLRPALRGRVEATYRLHRGLTLGVAALVDVDLTTTRYYVEHRSDRVEVASPIVLRPGLVVSLGWRSMDGAP